LVYRARLLNPGWSLYPGVETHLARLLNPGWPLHPGVDHGVVLRLERPHTGIADLRLALRSVPLDQKRLDHGG